MAFSSGLLWLGLGFLAFVAGQETNLNDFCNGDGPDAINSALPFLGLDPPPSADTQVSQFCLDVANRSRCFYVYIPEGVTGEVPLVFDIHGVGSCPIFSVSYTGWFQLAEMEKFVVVWPLGVTDAAVADITCFSVPGGLVVGNVTATDCCCSVGGPSDGETFEIIDPNITMDPEFLRMATEEVMDAIVGPATEGTVSIDPKKVFMAGHSNGCITALSMAALHSDLVTGVACHAGKLLTPFADDYEAVPTFIVHGLLDATVPYDAFLFTESEGFPSTPDQFRAIADRNGCTQELPTEQLPDGEGTVQTWSGCVHDANVTLVTLNNAGHTPYLGADEMDPGAVQTTIDTTAMAWDFLSKIGTGNEGTSSTMPSVPTMTAAPSVTPTPAPSDQPLPTTSPAPVLPAADPPSTAPATDSTSSAVPRQAGGTIGTVIVAVCLVGILF